MQAIEKGEALRAQVDENRLRAVPLQPLDTAMAEALELLAWLVSEGRLNFGSLCLATTTGSSITKEGIFHEKSGIAEIRPATGSPSTARSTKLPPDGCTTGKASTVSPRGADPDRVPGRKIETSPACSADQNNTIITLDVTDRDQAMTSFDSCRRTTNVLDQAAQGASALPPELPVQPEVRAAV